MKRLLVLLTLIATPALAENAVLKDKVIVAGDAVKLNDLLQTPVPQGEVALFAAPAPGRTGNIAAARAIEALSSYGISAAAAAQVIEVRREARKISAGEIEQVVAASAAAQLHADIQDVEVSFSRKPGDLALEKENAAALSLSSFRLEPVSGRFEARLFVPGSAVLNETAPAIVTGTLYETSGAVRIKRTVPRGQIITADDVELVRLKRQLVSSSMIRELPAAIGMTAKRNLAEDTQLRDSDVEKAKIVARNEMVLIVYETPAMTVTTRGKALNSGALGDTVEVLNLQSKRTLQAIITGEGKVTVSGAPQAKRQITAQNE